MGGGTDGAAALTPLARARAILGGSAGNLVEWYDWFAYASFQIYFAKAFFPKGDQTSELLRTSAIFAVGFLARPVGAWILGVFADRVGRKTALSVSVAFMCLGSLIVALVPGYKTIGAAAPAILVMARLLQGLSVGGEYGASATYLSEMAGRQRRGLWSSFQYVTLIGGELAALAVLMVLQHLLTGAQLGAWGWRIPFVIGALLAVVVFWIQWGLDETASFEREQPSARRRSSLVNLLTHHPREVAIVGGLTAGGSLAFYCFTAYMQTFLVNTAHFSKTTASGISAASLVLLLLIQPLIGWIGDLIGRRRLLTLSFGLGALTTWPLMSAIAGAREAGVALALVCAILIMHAGYTAVSAVVKAELFPTEVRALGVSLPYAVANTLFGGTAAWVALMFKQAGHESAFYLYVGAVLAVACAASLALPDTNRLGLIIDD